MVAIAIGLCVIGAAPAGDRDEQKGRRDAARDKAADVVDLTKLPPALAKQIRELVKKNDETKKDSITLIDAIKIVEATGKGQVESASRRLRKSETVFYVEINTGERRRTRLTLNAQGKVVDSRRAD
jgi:hypothetical protein